MVERQELNSKCNPYLMATSYLMVTSNPINKIWTFKSKNNIVPLLSEAEFDADIGCNLNLTLIQIYKVGTKIMVTPTAMMVTI